jgi:hypothetical protein
MFKLLSMRNIKIGTLVCQRQPRAQHRPLPHIRDLWASVKHRHAVLGPCATTLLREIQNPKTALSVPQRGDVL